MKDHFKDRVPKELKFKLWESVLSNKQTDSKNHIEASQFKKEVPVARGGTFYGRR